MKQHRLKVMALATALATGAMGAVTVQAGSVKDVLKEGKEKVASSAASQKRIDKIAEQTDNIAVDFDTVNKQIESTRLYNETLELQIAHQERQMANIRKNIDNVQETQREMPPLTIRMVDAVENYIQLDLPFRLDERRNAVEQLRNDIGRSDMTVAEKFRRVLEVYKYELEYGAVGSLDTYSQEIEIDGVVKQVDILRLGRVALCYQTKDKEHTGVWDQDNRQWVELDAGTYRSAVANAIRIAKKTATRDILTLPVKAPEVAQ
ncbi:DUF3450 domain-containing protein [Porticoccaceae bacterium LTM1]|nr:DUF3450 domain-containing protein [Porticoccaceae bacterium LTM1]